MPTQADYQRVDFPEAIDFFSRKINVPTDRWNDLKDAQHEGAFVSAGAKGALLQDLRSEVDRAIREGKSREDFKQEFNSIVERRGWNHTGDADWRAGIIYQTNLRAAYGEGRCRQMTDPDVVKARPYWMWIHGDTVHPRLNHLALDGKVFPSDAPLWSSMFPPSGFGCKCTMVTLSPRDVKRRGLKVEDAPLLGGLIPVTDPDSGVTKNVQVQPDKGFLRGCKEESEKERDGRRKEERRKIYDKIPEDMKRLALMGAALAVGGIALILATMATAGVTTSITLTALVAESLGVEADSIEVEVVGGEVAVKRKPVTAPVKTNTVDVKAETVEDGLKPSSRPSLPELVDEEIVGDVSSPNHWLDLDEFEKFDELAKSIVLAPPEDIVPSDQYKRPISMPDPESPRPVARKIREVVVPTKQAINDLRVSAKATLPFRVNINVNPKYPKSVAGTVNIQPGKRVGYRWTTEQAGQVRVWLEAQGYYVKVYPAGDAAYVEGFNFLKRFTDLEGS